MRVHVLENLIVEAEIAPKVEAVLLKHFDECRDQLLLLSEDASLVLVCLRNDAVWLQTRSDELHSLLG